MIIHRLVWQHVTGRHDEGFYRHQAREAIAWMAAKGVVVGPGVKVLDLGCGHGVFGLELVRSGCGVTFADKVNWLLPELAQHDFVETDVVRDDIANLGVFDLVVCSNMLEHIADIPVFIAKLGGIIAPGGVLYLSWTNWLSPWGGHEISPFHYLGPDLGTRLYDRLIGKKRLHSPHENLFPTYIGSVVRLVKAQPRLRLLDMAPRYYTEFSFIAKVPVLREFLTWNCAMLIGREPD